MENFFSQWKRFYDEIFNINLDVNGLKVPEFNAWYPLLMIVHEGLTTQKVFDECFKSFNCIILPKTIVGSLDELIVHNDRNPINGTYTFWCRGESTLDTGYGGVTVQNLTTPTMTLLERLLYELYVYHNLPNFHPDLNNQTLCAGSRDQLRNAPTVQFKQTADLYRLEIGFAKGSDMVDGFRVRGIVT